METFDRIAASFRDSRDKEQDNLLENMENMQDYVKFFTSLEFFDCNLGSNSFPALITTVTYSSHTGKASRIILDR